MANKIIRFDHSKQRLNERYNIDVDIDDYDLMCKIAQYGLIDNKKSKNRDSRVIFFKNTYILVGYNHKLKLINTVLYHNNRTKKIKYEKI